MLFASISKVILCLLVCFKAVKIASLQSSTPSIEIEKKIREIAEDIRSFRFAFAQEQILKFKGTINMAQIIHEAYQNKEESFFVILNFSYSLTRVDLTFEVLKSVRNEMVGNGHNDPMKMIPLAKAFLEDVVFQKNNDEIIKEESNKIVKEIKADVKKAATEILTEAMLSNNYFLNPKPENVAEEIFNFYYDLSDEIMREMVDRTYPFVPAIKIVDTIMRSSKFIPQKVSVFLEVFKKLEKDNDLNNEAVLLLASCIRDLRYERNYLNLFPNKKYDINGMIDKLPTCARNLFFADEICIWNRGKSEYLYAYNFQNNSSGRSVYTSAPEAVKTGEGSWRVEKLFEYFLFKSQTFKKEFLAASMRKYSRQGHYAQIKEKIFDDESNIWKIELSGEYCFIMNYKYNEYLFASNWMHDERERYVLSASLRANIDRIDFQWQIRDCS